MSSWLLGQAATHEAQLPWYTIDIDEGVKPLSILVASLAVPST